MKQLFETFLRDEGGKFVFKLDVHGRRGENGFDLGADGVFQEGRAQLLPADEVLLADLDDEVAGPLLSLPEEDVVGVRDDLQIL